MMTVPPKAPTLTLAPRDVSLELTLGLGPEDAVLALEEGTRKQDLQPWLLDAVAVKITCLGHHDEVPRPWDWENVLTSLEPGEELLYVLDHRAASQGSHAGSFDLWLAIRFPEHVEVAPKTLELREKRARVLISQLRRQAFPGSDVEWMEPQDLLGRLSSSTGPEERCVVVTGMPSPRSLDDDHRDVDREAASRNYQSLNDVVEALYDLGCDYRIAFVVERVGADELKTELTRKTDLFDRIHPLVEVSKRDGQNWASQWGKNSSFASAVGESLTKQTGTNENIGVNAGLGAAVGGALGFALGGPAGALIGSSALGALAGMVSVSKGRNASTSDGRSWTHTSTTGTNYGASLGASVDQTTQQVNSLLRLSDRSLERTISAMHEAHGTGGFRWGAFAFAEDQNARIVGRTLMGVLAGSRTKDHPLVRFEVQGEQGRLLASRTPAMELVAEAAPLLSLPRVCDALLVPEAELPGLRLRRNVFFGRNVDTQGHGSDRVVLGPDAFSAVASEAMPADIRISTGDLFKHLLVAGATGSGKTTRVVEVLNRLDVQEVSVVVFETAKRTYRTRLQRRGRPSPRVYSLGSSVSYGAASRFRPLRVNPFYFELGTPLKRHIAVLSDALAELMPTEAMIGPLLRRAVEACYDERSWDIEAARPRTGCVASWPTVVDFVVQVRKLAEQLTYGQEVNANYRGALESRASLFLDATFQDIFGYGGNTPIDELFPPGHDAIIEVEDLPPSDVDVRAFVMTLLLSRLRATQGARRANTRGSSNPQSEQRQVNDEPRQWLLVVEEAHNVLDRQFEVRRPADESNAGRTLLRSVVRLLQEGREMGIGVMVVDQSPTRLARDVISNTGTKIAMRLEDASEMAEIGQSMGLDEDAWQKLGFLQVGEALIKTLYMDRPAKSGCFQGHLLTAGPTEEHPSGQGSSPSFADLSSLWSPVLAGRGTGPDVMWAEALLARASGSCHLAAFSGLRTLLISRSDGATGDAVSLRAVLADERPSLKDIGATARDLWSDVVRRFYGRATVGAAATICSALAPSSAWRIEPMNHEGVALVARLLTSAGYGNVDGWSWALMQSQRPAGLARSRSALLALCSEGGGGDRTATVRVLLADRDEVRAIKASRPPPSPGALLARVGAALSAALPLDASRANRADLDVAESLLAEIEGRLARQLSLAIGAEYAREVEAFLSRMGRFQ